MILRAIGAGGAGAEAAVLDHHRHRDRGLSAGA